MVWRVTELWVTYDKKAGCTVWCNRLLCRCRIENYNTIFVVSIVPFDKFHTTRYTP